MTLLDRLLLRLSAKLHAPHGLSNASNARSSRSKWCARSLISLSRGLIATISRLLLGWIGLVRVLIGLGRWLRSVGLLISILGNSRLGHAILWCSWRYLAGYSGISTNLEGAGSVTSLLLLAMGGCILLLGRLRMLFVILLLALVIGKLLAILRLAVALRWRSRHCEIWL